MREADDGGSDGEHQREADATPKPAIPDGNGNDDILAKRTAFAAMLTVPLAKASPEQRRYADQLMAAAIAAAGSGRAFGRAEVQEPAGSESDDPRPPTLDEG